MLKATHGSLANDTASGSWLGETLQAAGATSSLAVVDNGIRLTYEELLEQAGRMATGLMAAGVEPGDAVLVQLPNWWETVVATWAVLLAQGAVVPVVPIYRTRELAHIVAETKPKVLLLPARYRRGAVADDAVALVRELDVPATVASVRGPAGGAIEFSELFGNRVSATTRPRSVDEIAVVLYTSGTTAQPKGVLHSHASLMAEVEAVAHWFRLGSRDRVYMASPLSHVTGLCYGILLPAYLQIPVVLQDRWEPEEAARRIEDEACTFTVGATPFLHGLVEAYEHRGPCHLSFFVCGGADIPASLVRHANQTLRTRVLRTYGSSELPTSTMGDPFGDVLGQSDGDGIPMGTNEIRIGPRCELEVRGPELFLGYVDANLNGQSFTADGFFRTGDAAYIDDNGVLHITGRIKDIVNRGGEKFSAAEIEEVLLGHPGVHDVAIVGSPDPVLGERVCAFVVVEDGWDVDIDGLRRHVIEEGLAIQKAPEKVVVTEALPRTPSGKLQRYVLRQQLCEEST